MEENNVGKKHKRERGGAFNVLDIVILVIVLFIAAMAVMLTVPRFQKAATIGDKVGITYTVTFEKISREFENIIDIDGQTVTDLVSGAEIGTVAGTPDPETYYEYVLSADTAEDGGRILTRKSYDELGYINLTVTVTATAVYNEGSGYTVNGYRIAIGRPMELRFAGFTGTGVCGSLTPAANDGR